MLFTVSYLIYDIREDIYLYERILKVESTIKHVKRSFFKVMLSILPQKHVVERI